MSRLEGVGLGAACGAGSGRREAGSQRLLSVARGERSALAWPAGPHAAWGGGKGKPKSRGTTGFGLGDGVKRGGAGGPWATGGRLRAPFLWDPFTWGRWGCDNGSLYGFGSY